MIQIRRNPLLAIAFFLVGGLALGLGLYFMIYAVVLGGVILIGGGGLLMLNPAVTITEKKVTLHNLFGTAAVSYPHDGFAQLRVHEEKLWIQHQGMQAPIRKVNSRDLHKGDWNTMLAIIEKAKLAPQNTSKK